MAGVQVCPRTKQLMSIYLHQALLEKDMGVKWARDSFELGGVFCQGGREEESSFSWGLGTGIAEDSSQIVAPWRSKAKAVLAFALFRLPGEQAPAGPLNCCGLRSGHLSQCHLHSAHFSAGERALLVLSSGIQVICISATVQRHKNGCFPVSDSDKHV